MRIINKSKERLKYLNNLVDNVAKSRYPNVNYEYYNTIANCVLNNMKLHRVMCNNVEKMTKEEIQQVEDLVNEQFKRDLPVTCEEMSYEDAKKSGAIGLFTDKYGDKVKVYTIGDFSKEICGGPHVTHTGDMGRFKIKKEESSSSGVRRIKAVLIKE